MRCRRFTDAAAGRRGHGGGAVRRWGGEGAATKVMTGGGGLHRAGEEGEGMPDGSGYE
jgi:hypothetical protein